MKSKPQTSPARTRQLELLAAWIKEWKIAARLETMTPAAEPPSRRIEYTVFGAQREAARLRVGANPLTEGDIVLLPPDAEATRARPWYVALLSSERPGRWLAAPFGRFPLPALPGEWATGRRAGPLKVICLWNRGLLGEERLRRGWRVGRMTAREQTAVAQLMAPMAERALTARLASRIGPPLAHPLDPRHDYIEDERLLWLPEPSQLRLAESPPRYAPADKAILPMAAEREKGWNRTSDGE